MPLRDSAAVLLAVAVDVLLLSGVLEDTAAGLASKEEEAEAEGEAVAVVPTLFVPAQQSQLLEII